MREAKSNFYMGFTEEKQLSEIKRNKRMRGTLGYSGTSLEIRIGCCKAVRKSQVRHSEIKTGILVCKTKHGLLRQFASDGLRIIWCSSSLNMRKK